MKDDFRRLKHILAAADELETYLAGHAVDDFLEDTMRQRATERLLMIIGEAAKSLAEETRLSIDQPWREIIRFRDRGIHGYDSVDPEIVFRIARESVPELQQAVAAYLDAHPKG